MRKKQRNTLIIVVVVLALVVFAVLSIYFREQGQVRQSTSQNDFLGQVRQTQEQPQDTTSVSQEPTPAEDVAAPVEKPVLPKEPDRFSTEEDLGVAPDLQVFEVNFTKTGFTPAQLTIRKGDIVQFINASSESFWLVSTNGYKGLDSEKQVQKGESFPFQFNEVGQWSYKDKLVSGFSGQVLVEE